MRMFFEIMMVFAVLFGLSYLSRRMQRWYEKNKPTDLPNINDGSPASAMLWVADEDPSFVEMGRYIELNEDKKE